MTASKAQQSNLKISYQLSLARAVYKANTSDPVRAVCLQLKGGALLQQKFNRFAVNLGVTPGLRLANSKERPIFVSRNPNPDNLDEISYVNSFQDFYSSKQWFAEINLSCSYFMFKDKVNFSVGVGGQRDLKRHLWPLGGQSSANVFGGLWGANYRLTNHLTIGANYFVGLNKLFKAFYLDSNRVISTRENYIQASIFINP